MRLSAQSLTHREKNIMAKKAVSSTKNSPVVITSTIITTSWNKVVADTLKGEELGLKAILALGASMEKSALSVRDIQAVIKSSEKESPVVKISHVEGIPTLVHLMTFPEFQALPLSKKLSKATNAYKVMGSEKSKSVQSWAVVESEIKLGNAEKNSASPKSEKESKSPKAKKSDLEIVQKFSDYVLSLDPNDDELIFALQELGIAIESKVGTFADI